MIYKRFAANLRVQNWFAIGVELGIVILGVFIGTWVANWNSERSDKAGVQRLIAQLQPRLRSIIPDEVQQRILADCGDQYATKGRHFWLPATCAAPIDPAVARSTAAALRAHPALIAALTSHMAHVTRHLGSDAAYAKLLSQLDERISETRQ